MADPRGGAMNWILKALGPELLTPGLVSRLRLQELIRDSDVVEIELSRMMQGLDLIQQEEQIAILVGDGVAYVPELVWEMAHRFPLTDCERELVLLIRLMEARRRWRFLTEPGFYVESELEDWDVNGDYDDLRFSTPPPKGQRRRAMDGYVARLDARVQQRVDELKNETRSSGCPDS
ncbi:hypothetical protein LC082_10360 [Microbacterium esteraromaticum]|uniref:hypothetical protein n=1 Tax=Microbacterium esteraromaticum TaxID=57043 RepID=UPI001CD348F4|nr:hypothetical protein [Microbacterium esteraromaticum]MCA1307302.1 hypothetical protein [Microbacterium esteraromaticum]